MCFAQSDALSKLDRLRQKAADLRAKRDELGWKLGKAENAVRPDPGLVARLRRDYLAAHNKWIDAERELEREERQQGR
jgi:hypothetical protein